MPWPGKENWLKSAENNPRFRHDWVTDISFVFVKQSFQQVRRFGGPFFLHGMSRLTNAD